MERAGDQLDHASRWRHAARDRKMKGKRIEKTRIRIEESRSVDMLHEEKREEEDEEEDNRLVRFRRCWERSYSNEYGSSDTTTLVPPMLYTFGSVPKYAIPDNTLQIFSIKIAELKEEEGLHWPLHVYGSIATRDSIDPRRNLLFHRTRDNCQTITEGVPFLLLTGPSRAVMILDPVTFEVQLKAKGRSESEDKVLCFGIYGTQHAASYSRDSCILTSHLYGNRSRIEFAFAVLFQSVEATIRIEVVDGSWPEDIRGLVTARTASIDHTGIMLVDSRDGRMPISNYGVVGLSRQVVCVELDGELKVDVVALQVGDDGIYLDAAKGLVVFAPKEAGISHDTCDLGFCKLGITVGWSLLAPVEREPWGIAWPDNVPVPRYSS